MEALQNLAHRIDLPSGLLESHKVLFTEAFTHRSAITSNTVNEHNERLEFLGDAVLELVTTEFLFHKFPDPEGVLTNYRSALVKRENLATVARKLELGEILRLSRGEDRSGGRGKDYLLANALEALIGALYLAGGMTVAEEFIRRFVLVELDEILEEGAHIDAKSAFQEFTQGEFGITPTYEVLEAVGKDHEKEFKMGAYLDETLVGTGSGKSKKEAQTDAALQALTAKETWSPNFEKKESN
ncbi:ribonuclease III [bacterium]|nr:ribonuclease III [bacterium]NCQ55499.1 ribonuclease III [Candidatus Parcubacteria bacterium]NCS96325.1 ribonuclease III [bacterium]